MRGVRGQGQIAVSHGGFSGGWGWGTNHGYGKGEGECVKKKRCELRLLGTCSVAGASASK